MHQFFSSTPLVDHLDSIFLECLCEEGFTPSSIVWLPACFATRKLWISVLMPGHNHVLTIKGFHRDDNNFVLEFRSSECCGAWWGIGIACLFSCTCFDPLSISSRPLPPFVDHVNEANFQFRFHDCRKLCLVICNLHFFFLMIKFESSALFFTLLDFEKKKILLATMGYFLVIIVYLMKDQPIENSKVIEAHSSFLLNPIETLEKSERSHQSEFFCCWSLYLIVVVLPMLYPGQQKRTPLSLVWWRRCYGYFTTTFSLTDNPFVDCPMHVSYKNNHMDHVRGQKESVYVILFKSSKSHNLPRIKAHLEHIPSLIVGYEYPSFRWNAFTESWNITIHHQTNKQMWLWKWLNQSCSNIYFIC